MTGNPNLRPYIHWRNPILGKFYYNKSIGKPKKVKPVMRPRDRAMLQRHQMPPVSFEASKVVQCADPQKRFFHPSEVVRRDDRPQDPKIQNVQKKAA